MNSALSTTTVPIRPPDTSIANRRMDGQRHALLDQIERGFEGFNRFPEILEWIQDTESLRPNVLSRLLKLCDDKPMNFPHDFRKTVMWELIPAALNLLDIRKDQRWGKAKIYLQEVLQGAQDIMTTEDLVWLNAILAYRDQQTAEFQNHSVTALSVTHPKGN